MSADPIRVLFVCMGNICRSPLAEGVFRHLAREAGVEHRFEIDSAGTSSYHVGHPPDSRSVSTARARGVEVTGKSRQLTGADLRRFDYIIVMDEENLSSLRGLAARAGGAAKIHLLREWDPREPGGSVPDPYYGGVNGFEEVHEMVERACQHLLEGLLASSSRA